MDELPKFSILLSINIMTEIPLSKAIVFKEGFIIRTSSILTPSDSYILTIQYGTIQISRTYTPLAQTYNIIDSWGDINNPINGEIVCFTLSTITASSGSISLTSDPSGANIWINGTDMGITTPNTLSGLNPGNYNISLKLTNYQDYNITVSVEAGLTTTINATMSSFPAKFIHELTLFTNNVYSNPYTEVEISATFSHPQAGNLTIPGYWDGANIWKIRFRPIASGQWSYTIVSTDVQMNGITGTILADTTGDKGYVQRDPANVFGWRTSIDYQPHLWISDTLWRWNQRVTLIQFQEYINSRISQGYNHVRGHLNSMDDANGNASNEGGSIFVSGNWDILNSAYFQATDTKIEYAHNNGITMDITFGAGDRFPLITIPQMERYLKYIIARYSAYNIDWEGLSEYEEYSSGTYSNAISIINAIGNYLKNNDPYQHPRSTHTLNSTTELVPYGWMDWIMYQTTGENPSQILSNRVYNLPQINEEFYYEKSPCSTNTTFHNGTSDNMRKGAWILRMTGAFFSTGNSATYTGGSNQYQSCGLYDIGISQIKHLSNFWLQRKHHLYNPNNILIISGTAYVSEITGKELIAYIVSGSNIMLNLSAYAGIFSVVWYNPRNGMYGNTTFISGGAITSFSSPDIEDWILYIYQSCPQL